MTGEAWRAFLAVFPPPEVEEALNAYVRELRRDLREISWVKPGNLHLTFRFFGELPQDSVDTVAAAARQAAAARRAFRLGFGDPGAFPTLQNPRVAWLGIEGGRADLAGLAADLEQALVKAGLGRADKPFAPHLTLGRVRESLPSATLPALFRRHPAPRLEFEVRQVLLIRSQLDPKGSIYSRLAAAELTA